MYDADLLTTDLLGVLEGESQNTLAGRAGNELNTLDHTVDNDVFDSRVLALGVLSDQDGIDVIVGGLVPSNGAARSQVGKEVKCSAESEVERDMALTDGGLSSVSSCATGVRESNSLDTYGQRSLQGNLVSLDALNSGVGDDGLAVLENGGNINGLPGNWCLCRIGKRSCGGQKATGNCRRYLGSLEDVLHSLGDLGTDAIALDDADCVAALSRSVLVLVVVHWQHDKCAACPWWPGLSDFRHHVVTQASRAEGMEMVAARTSAFLEPWNLATLSE